ncbi:MAG TPA: cyanate hydratase, partial [Methylocella sp.]|nr:cyanate hydratase [Methylocella sp.]
MITGRNEVTNMIRAAKVEKNIKWAEVAAAIGQSKEWTTAGYLGQMAFTKEQAEKIGAIFGLSGEAVAWRQIAPYKRSVPTT